MSSFTHEESEIIRDADMTGMLKKRSASTMAFCLARAAASIEELIDDGAPLEEIEIAIGELGIVKIELCAKLDLDLTTCIRKARKQ